MTLPKGFDPRNMSFAAFRPAAQNSQSPSGQGDSEELRPLSGLRHTRSRQSGMWARYDDFISDIGYWFEDNGETMSVYLTMAVLAVMIISFVVSIVRIWHSGHPFSAIVTAIIGGLVAVHGFWIICVIPFACFWVIFYLCRLVFKNAAWFTTEVLIALGIYYLSTHKVVLASIIEFVHSLGL